MKKIKIPFFTVPNEQKFFPQPVESRRSSCRLLLTYVLGSIYRSGLNRKFRFAENSYRPNVFGKNRNHSGRGNKINYFLRSHLNKKS